MIPDWLSNNLIEIFGAITGIIYVFLEIRQNIWLWPVGIVTSAVYIIVFFTSKFYADMSLQVYYLVISIAGWVWWVKGARRGAEGAGQEKTDRLRDRQTATPQDSKTVRLYVTRLTLKTSLILSMVFILLYFLMWFVLSQLTDSPVPEWDSFITSLSVIATWMLARKIYEHWYLWMIVNCTSVILFLTRGLYPTIILYVVYLVMSFVGLKEWKRSL